MQTKTVRVTATYRSVVVIRGGEGWIVRLYNDGRSSLRRPDCQTPRNVWKREELIAAAQAA